MMKNEKSPYTLLRMNRLNGGTAGIALIAVLVLLFSGCLKASTEGNGESSSNGGNFRHRWWNHYARALDHADHQAYEAAKQDLTVALDRRYEDQRMARTYGMHFIDYFPHRELGVIHWIEGNLEAARRELERSIAQHPSAKAQYYLDLVRKTVIQRSGERVLPPELEFTNASGEFFRTREDPVVVHGRARDPNYVAAITIAGKPLYLEASTKEHAFSQNLSLPQGRHSIAVTASNLAGAETTRTISIQVDRQGPWVVIEEAYREKDGIEFKGFLSDESGVATLSINDKEMAISNGARPRFKLRVDAGLKAIVFRAADLLGNTTVVPIPSDALIALISSPPLVAAKPSNLVLAGIFSERDRTLPVIRLEDWKEKQTVYMDQVVLSGSVRDKGRVARLTINGEPVLSHTGAMVLFSHYLHLQEGTNRIIITAEDRSGNQTVKQIVIERKTPRVRLLSERLRLSVFAFERSGEVTDISFAFQDSFIHQLLQLDRFQLIEREMLEKILQEQKMSRSRLIDRPTAVRLGRLAAAHAIVAGSMVETRTGIEIIGRVVDSETSEILATSDAYGEEKSMVGLKHLAKVMALKIHREFPLTDGMIVDREGNYIVTDLGTEKIRAQRRIIVYQERPVHHPETGKPLGKECRVLGGARVIQSEAHLSKAKLEPGCAATVQPRQKVMTR